LIDPATFFGGSMTLDTERARSAVMSRIAEGAGLSLEEALDAAERAWCQKVADSLKNYTRIDERTALAAFGGAGAFLVTDIAEAAGMRRAIIPGLAAVFSAFGIGFSDIAQSYQRRLDLGDRTAVDAAVEELLDSAQRDMFAEGFEIESCVTEWSVGDERSRYAWKPGSPMPQETIEPATSVIGLRVVRPLNRASLGAAERVRPVAAVSSTTRRLRVPGEGDVTLPVYALHQQPAGASARGPCILEEAYFTGRIGAGWNFTINGNRDTLLTRADRGETP
jgi:N-methylhydantoinase A/oxoprolinase/acetone carboxylase beta subunit